MDRRGQLMAVWLEEEGQRQQRRLALPLRVEFPVVRGLIQLRLCIFLGVLAVGLFVCWLASAWDQAGRIGKTNDFRTRGTQRAAGDPQVIHAKSGATVLRFADEIVVIEPGRDPEVFHAKSVPAVFVGDEIIMVDP
jgi:hypothetical protein